MLQSEISEIERVEADGLDENCWEQRRHQQCGENTVDKSSEISLIVSC